MSIYLFNTQSRTKELFKPQNNHNVSLYVCGITPYDYAHMGHGRCYITFDLLYRILTYYGYNVTYVRNYTDIDDKIINKVSVDRIETLSLLDQCKKITDTYITAYESDMEKLGCIKPDYQPTVTQHIDEIITFIQELIVQSHAYIINNDVYFSIESIDNYGELSGRNLNDLKSGARVTINNEKKHPADFALWKGNNEQLFWQSPWGYGRPGWHIECSALAKKYFNQTIDIHGGGADLIFPHHENEKAQSESLHHKPFVNYWMHNAFVTINKEKMSKSLGNFLTLEQLYITYDPMIIRYYFLTHHYRHPLEFSSDLLDQSSSAYKKLISWFTDITVSTQLSYTNIDKSTYAKKLWNTLADDMNTPLFFGLLFENSKAILADEQEKELVKHLLTNILGLSLKSCNQTIKITETIEQLIEEREQARKEKNWLKADEIREQLNTMGIILQDKKINKKT